MGRSSKAEAKDGGSKPKKPDAPSLESKGLDLDLRNMTISNISLDTSGINQAQILKSTQEAAQVLVSGLINLPPVLTKNDDRGIVVSLPMGKTKIPRELPPPANTKAATKWSDYAKRKEIKPQKKGRKEWNPETGKWENGYGYDRKLAEKRDNWLLEVPENFEQTTKTGDPFLDRELAAKERKQKNKDQQSANQRRAAKIEQEKKQLATRSQSAFDLEHKKKFKKGKGKKGKKGKK